MKIALVHDYLPNWGGAEDVLWHLHKMWPEAPIYTIFSNVDRGSDLVLDQKFVKAKIITSWFDKLPFRRKLMSPLRFLLPIIWKGFDFSKYDLIITSASWAITKGLAKSKTKEICYCHTPPRILYGYDTSRNWQKYWYIRIYALITNYFLRMYDFNQAQKVDQFVANSREVQKRIKKFYRRESVIVNPPVKINKGKIHNSLFNIHSFYYLAGGRLEKAKNFDLIIKAFNKIKLPLKVYGTGTQERYLKDIAGRTIEFLGKISQEEKQQLMAKCQALIVAATDEDFGITPVEAMAAGRPVIAYRGGGYLETVVEGKTGEFFDEATTKSLVAKLQSFKVTKYKAEDCRKQAEKFSEEIFNKKIKKIVEEVFKNG
jgi:glycosyltransferase involved in cell wall biosynthesis